MRLGLRRANGAVRVAPAASSFAVADDVAIVFGGQERPGPQQEGEAQWLVRERPAGTFARQLTLGQGLAVDRIQADYADGVLTLTIPLAEESKPRKIQVTASGGQKTIEQGGQQGSAEGSGQAQ